jgi:hypothetical protein
LFRDSLGCVIGSTAAEREDEAMERRGRVKRTFSIIQDSLEERMLSMAGAHMCVALSLGLVA